MKSWLPSQDNGDWDSAAASDRTADKCSTVASRGEGHMWPDWNLQCLGMWESHASQKGLWQLATSTMLSADSCILQTPPKLFLCAKHCKESISPCRRQRHILKLCQYNVGNWMAQTCIRVECHRDGWAAAPGQSGFWTKVIGKEVSKNVPLILRMIFKGSCRILFSFVLLFHKGQSRSYWMKYPMRLLSQPTLPRCHAYVDSGVRKPIPSCHSYSGDRHVRNIGEEERFLFVLGIFPLIIFHPKRSFGSGLGHMTWKEKLRMIQQLRKGSSWYILAGTQLWLYSWPQSTLGDWGGRQ